MIKLSAHNESEVHGLIKLSIGSPTPEKVQEILISYDEPDHHLLGYYSEGKLVGLIGLQTHETHGIIKHIAVEEAYQKQGIGKTLITEAINDLGLKTCESETDEEGKGFYEKCGFTINAFTGPYGGRFKCSFRLPLNPP